MRCFSQPIRIAFAERSLHVCLRSEWVSAVFVHYTPFTVKALFTSKDRDRDANRGKNCAPTEVKKKLDSSLGMKYAIRKQINNCWAQHSMAQKEKKGLFNRKSRRREANFSGKDVISCFALMYRGRLGFIVSTDLKWLAFICTVSETPYDRKPI